MKRLFFSGFLMFFSTVAFGAKPEGGTLTLQLTHAGLPTLTYVFDRSGTLTAVRSATTTIVAYDWPAAPYEVPVRFFSRWQVVTDVLPDDTLLQQVLDSHGAQRLFGSIAANDRQFNRPEALLDTLATEMGLGHGWQTGIQTVAPGVVDLWTSNGKSLKIRMHLISPGIRIGEAEGTALFWDLDLPLPLHGRIAQAVPSRLIVTASGSVQLAVDVPMAGGLESIWTSDHSGNRVSFRQLQSDQTAHAGSFGDVHSEMMWQCGSSEDFTCFDYSGGSYCDYEYTAYYCDTGGGGDGDPGGSGGGSTSTPLTRQRDTYVTNGCGTIPDTNQFLDRNGYNATGVSNFFSFDSFKSSYGDYVLVNQALVSGLYQMQAELDTMSMPRLSLNGDGAGYRIAGEDSSTPCGDHCYGEAVDLSVRNSSGVHDCQIWNALAGAANAAGGWVEPVAMIAPNGGVPDHFHVGFDGRTNTNYGDACTN